MLKADASCPHHAAFQSNQSGSFLPLRTQCPYKRKKSASKVGASALIPFAKDTSFIIWFLAPQRFVQSQRLPL